MKAISWALSGLLLSYSLAAQEMRVKFAIGEWAPYTSSSGNPNEKVAEQIVVKAFESQGYQVELDYFPWPRSLRLASQDKYDGSFPWMVSDSRQEQFLISVPFFTQKIVFFSHKDVGFTCSNAEDLKKYVIGATQDYQATNHLISLGVKLTIASTEEINFIKLSKKRIDAYPTGLIRGKYLLGKLLDSKEAAQIQISNQSLMGDGIEMHILFSKHNLERSQHLNRVFARGLKQLIDSGEYQLIVFDSNRINE
ncbi:substrate-binding periplasmic protein [Vibrio aestuarianus]|uniref:Transporter substrate-binding domain-containing protein n=1 Tax=Vibrio aestuarianus TaxID=28171 RepID=A0A9X4IQH8_9VIBR|nr:transporter substrate-binding domain-containing protein [Vibrio aestuarianus]MDE1243041.1 transporter substrate-binding domain-containing protein [Vibrio aestuarianus]